jgi:hypothetical protein
MRERSGLISTQYITPILNARRNLKCAVDRIRGPARNIRREGVQQASRVCLARGFATKNTLNLERSFLDMGRFQ